MSLACNEVLSVTHTATATSGTDFLIVIGSPVFADPFALV